MLSARKPAGGWMQNPRPSRKTTMTLRRFAFQTDRAGVALWRAAACLWVLYMLSGGVPAGAQMSTSTSTPPGELVATGRTAPRTVDDILSGAEKASGISSVHGAWRLTGTARAHGADQAFEMVSDARFRFRMAVTGPLSQTDAFDGSASWTCGPSGVPHRLILQERDVNRLIAWTITGAWAERSAPLMRETAP